ncbi:hypothetical protein TREES_T100011653 [Tupaia chinensis]|uniref:Uncharacterized protein n=1 Tax=Tupaia chinensis TaxID=246437 RepID=L9L2L3_TUPCH|nr:hypothetical protein TREES_T100011653 [Tupaia chinensis]
MSTLPSCQPLGDFRRTNARGTPLKDPAASWQQTWEPAAASSDPQLHILLFSLQLTAGIVPKLTAGIVPKVSRLFWKPFPHQQASLCDSTGKALGKAKIFTQSFRQEMEFLQNGAAMLSPDKASRKICPEPPSILRCEERFPSTAAVHASLELHFFVSTE